MKIRHNLIHINWFKLLLFLLIGSGGYIFTTNNAHLYKSPIGQVVAVQNHHRTAQTDNFNNKDYQQTQTLKLKVLNGSYRGHFIKLDNTFSYSNAYDLRYHRGQQLFLNLPSLKKPSAIMITGMKRDTILFSITYLAIGLLLLIVKVHGLMALISVLLNAVFFFAAIKIDVVTHATTTNVLVIFGLLAVLLLGITALLTFGYSKQALILFCSSLSSTFLGLLLSIIILTKTGYNGINFEMMGYVTQLRIPLYLAGSILGALGAVMDVATDITASLFVLSYQNPTLNFKDFMRAGRKIGQSVMGPLINVLFLIFIAGTLPMVILTMRNGNNFSYTFAMVMSLGIVQSIISGIAIALTIPITTILTSWYCYQKREGK
ncbi:YibE/F family protein [Liquorilactobacillus capillatus]|uniref:YibE/F family protein n=1 Tax=Liquorilactobacillus capillatus TaxID=480931 RepID=UPI000B126DDF|nr:YibE/F family protein [Liquorilactobacillus capillatus]